MDQAARAGRPGGGSAARPTAAKSGRTAWGSVPRRGAGYGGQVPHQARLESSVTCQCQTPPTLRTPTTIGQAAAQELRALRSPACWEFSPRTTSISRLTVRFLHGSPLSGGRRRLCHFCARTIERGEGPSVSTPIAERLQVSMIATIMADGDPWSPPGRPTQNLVPARAWGFDSPSRHQHLANPAASRFPLVSLPVSLRTATSFSTASRRRLGERWPYPRVVASVLWSEVV